MKHHLPAPSLSLSALVPLLAAFALLLAAGCGGGGKPAPKLLVIGLDGATFTTLTPWMEAGHLPRLRALRDGGAWGTLDSVIPPLSPPAWTTAVTGVNPGQHGIFDFFRPDMDSLLALGETAAGRRVPALWTLFSEAGRGVGVMNIPMTDPPDPVNGFMVAGLPHPDPAGYAYPPEVEAELRRQGYRLDRMGEALIPGEEAALEEEIFDTFRRRRDAALALCAERPELDLAWIVFTGTDRMQHFFWKFMEEEHPFHDPALAPRFGDSILRLYREIDAAVGALVDQAQAQADAQGRELAVIVLSDHGFCGVHRAFRPQSYLRRPPDGKPPITAAYSLESNATLLYVPRQGRERGARLTAEEHDRVLDDILSRILAARDPQGGVSPVLFGARSEDVYRGRYVDKAPDLVFLARPPYYLINEAGDKEPFGTPAFSFSAHHELHGILIASGPMFGKGHLEGEMGLIDIAPTMMHLGGFAVPEYMEGEVLTALFDPEFARSHPVRWEAGEARETGNEDRERVRSVPYVQ